MMPEDGLSSIRAGFIQDPNPNPSPCSNPSNKRKRNLPGTPDPEAEVMALSPKSLMATNRFLCEICNKGFRRDQNLQLHRRGHNLPWKLKQRANKDQVRKKVYICPEKTCVHHDPSRALGDLTGIKKHYSRKHGEKKWKCEKCSKKYAVQSDWKAHAKICGTKEYKCDCGTLFSRKDSFITHRAFCDALAEESVRFTPAVNPSPGHTFRNNHLIGVGTGGLNNLHQNPTNPQFPGYLKAGLEQGLDLQKPSFPVWLDHHSHHVNTSSIGPNLGSSTNLSELVQMAANAQRNPWLISSNNMNNNNNATSSSSMLRGVALKEEDGNKGTFSEALSSLYYNSTIQNENNNNNPPAPMSATALLQKAAQMGPARSNSSAGFGFGLMGSSGFSCLGSYGSSLNNVQTINNNEVEENSSLGGPESLGHGPLMGPTSEHHLLHRLLVGEMGMRSGSAAKQTSSGIFNIEGESSMTRDFLGVGGNEKRQFWEEQSDEVAKFASLGGGMDMDGHFSRSH